LASKIAQTRTPCRSPQLHEQFFIGTYYLLPRIV
jgi:hypothetical protein